MAITLAITNTKRGVGKTTTCANLGAALSSEGKRSSRWTMIPRAI